MSSPIYAANSFIIRANENGVNMSHLKIQKLLYILYARFLAESGNPLFSNRFVAWRYGPVITDLYDVFNKYGRNTIKAPHPDLNSETKYFVLNGIFGKCFEEVWNKYAWQSGWDLVNKTHQDDSAWSKAKVCNNGILGGFLKDEDIREDGRRWF
jgi:uncharacterized phage-associated protein